jgi:hypothetical protein
MRRAWRGGETVTVSVHLSHYGSQPLRDTLLAWTLIGDGLSESGGKIEILNVAPAQALALAPLRFGLPTVPRPTRASLWLALGDAAGNEVTRSELPLLVFPPVVAPARGVACADKTLTGALRKAGYAVVGSDLDVPLVVSTLGESDRRFVERGGRALFLAETPDALQTVVPRLSLESRRGTPWAGDWASSFAWYRRDLWADEIPGDGRLDFAFSSVLPETIIKSVHPADIRQEVLAGLFVGWLRRPVGLVRKLPLGKGVLLVSTLRLKDNIGQDPLAEVLLSELLSLL